MVASGPESALEPSPGTVLGELRAQLGPKTPPSSRSPTTTAASASDAVGVVGGHISGDMECRCGVEHSTDMEMDLDSRNSALVVGEELNDCVDIPRYEHHSTWGYDLNTRFYWASLWPNNGDRDAPPTDSVG